MTTENIASPDFARAVLHWNSPKGRRKKDAAREVLQSFDFDSQWMAWGNIWGADRTGGDFATPPTLDVLALARKGRRKAVAEVVVRWLEWEWQYRFAGI